MKVIEKIKEAETQNKILFSFEYFPPKTEDGVENLFERMERMVLHSPSFCDITWGAGGSTADLTLEIANRMQNVIGVETMMHLTCTNMPVEKIDHALDVIKSNGLKNVLALRGDPPHGQDKFVQVDGGFACALDLVNHMRKKYGDYFGITVAGYPEAHPDAIEANGLATSESYESDLAYLKQKVDAGADLIVTQLFYDTDNFLKFVNDCRQIGIKCPIVPGIMPINNYKGFVRMTGFCKTKIPQEITDALEPIKDNEEAVKAYGVHLGTEMCKKILASGIKQLHLYTFNMAKSALAILLNLGLIEESKIERSLPWKRPAHQNRGKEDVRPIFWANRPKSYIIRTKGWEQYPHGRFGDAHNASYGALSDHQFMRPRARDLKLQEEWAIPLKNVEDINEPGEQNGIGYVFNTLVKQLANPVEFELPDWFNKWQPAPYTFIKRNIYLTKKSKKRHEDDGIFCSCCQSPGSDAVCGRDCHCGMLLSSCSSGCRCGSACVNKPFQHRPVKKMKLVQTEKCGSGIVADEDIKQGEFVIEYVGEVIDDKECEERLWKMKHRGETNFYLCEVNRDMVIDASYKGNKSRYINHCCSPNTEMQKWSIDGETRIGIFATRDINKGEHLTYDYQFVQFGADQDCHCGAVSCRQKLGVKPNKMLSDAALKLVARQVCLNGGLRGGVTYNLRRNSNNCIGEVVMILRPVNKRLFGIIKRFDRISKKHLIMFEDGTAEFIDMSKEDWEVCNLLL